MSLSNSFFNDNNFHLRYSQAINGTSLLWIGLLSTLVVLVLFVMQLELNFEEIWKDVPEHPGIMASNFGRIQSKGKWVTHKGSIEKIKFLPGRLITLNTYLGYVRVWYSGTEMNQGKHKMAHRLVAMAFIPNPENKKEVNHINGIKTDNRVDNLEWVTPQENMRHAHDTGLKKGICGEDNVRAKTTKETVIKMREMYKSGAKACDVGRYFNMNYTNAWGILTGRSWKHLL